MNRRWDGDSSCTEPKHAGEGANQSGAWFKAWFYEEKSAWEWGFVLPMRGKYAVRLQCGSDTEERRVPTLAVAAMVVQNYVTEHHLGSRNWKGGEVRDLATGHTRRLHYL